MGSHTWIVRIVGISDDEEEHDDEEIANVLASPDRTGLDAQDCCPVCHEELLPQDDTALCRIRACGHAYCRSCIQRWLRNHPTCPVCKRDVFAPSATAPPGLLQGPLGVHGSHGSNQLL